MRKLHLRKYPAGRYKYMVKFYSRVENHNLRNYLKNGFGPNRPKIRSYYNYEYLEAVFVENTKQLMRLKLVFPEDIQTIFEIVIPDQPTVL